MKLKHRTYYYITEDACRAIHSSNFTETLFADDLNCMKEYEMSAKSEGIYEDLHACQESLHKWGRAN